MTELPRGTVTFLFSDIEGSTRLLTRLRAGYTQVFREHQDVLRAAFEEHDGREVHTAGDAFFVAFARASDAIAAAVAGQRALASHGWPEGVDVRVRMGLHTGEAALLHGDYFGLDVHRAARICSAGHGGQVLVSSTTYDLVADELPEGVALRALGEHRLKDLDRPEHLFQIATGDLPADFPPLNSVGAGANGLPTPPNRTIGREDDVRAIADRLGDPDAARLLTLLGPGGVGKTRLAQEAARTVAREFTAGARFVSLAPVGRADDVPTAVLQALGITPDAGEDPTRAVRRYLSAKHLLLVLDNFEHVLEATSLVSDLLGNCPSLAVLATSREALSLAGEQRYLVAPLALPVEPDEARALEKVPAVALFAERARAQHPGFAITAGNAAAVIEVCRRVDGLPLAIELAAARCDVLTPADLAERLAAALSVLGRGPRDVPARQQTLRATIDWSHQLLSPAEARAFAGFAVFAGGATVTAAERVTGADLDVLDALVDKHLLQRRDDASGEARLIMLETIRAYARERLEAGEAVAGVHDRHCRHYVALAESAEPALSTAAEAEWLPRLDAEIDNVRAALGWSLRHGDATLGLRLAGLLAEFWDIRAISGEGLEWLQAALEAAGDAAPLGDRARALRGRLKLLEEQGSAYEAGDVMEQTKACANEALALSRRAGDPAGIADALLLLSHLETAESLPQRRRRALADEALTYARRAGDEKLIAEALTDRAAAVAADEGAEELEEAMAALRKLGSGRTLATLYNKAAYVTIKAGIPERGRPYLEHAASLARELGDEMLLCAVFGNAGLTALLTGNTGDARAAFGEQLRICKHLVIPWLASEGLAGLSAIASRDGDLDRAARLLGAARASGPIGDADVLAQLEREFFAPARERHGERRWREGQAAGAGLSFEDAITLAVGHPAVP